MEDTTEFRSLAKSIALALDDVSLRQVVKAEIARSVVRESKVHLNSFVAPGGSGRSLLQTGAAGNKDKTLEELDELLSAGDFELYMPVPAHRAKWAGGKDLLVVWHLDEGFKPVAYDLAGEEASVSGTTPPETPALVIVPAETDFEAVGQNGPAQAGLSGCAVSDASTLATAIDHCRSERREAVAPLPASSGSAVPDSGIYMTRMFVDELLESWTKGDPEIEIFVIGKTDQSPPDNIEALQCAADEAASSSNQPGVPSVKYSFNQDNHDWDTNAPGYSAVLLFSTDQIRDAQPFTDGFVLHVWEDDDETCLIMTDESVKDLIEDVGVAAAQIGVQVLFGDAGQFITSSAFQSIIEELITDASNLIETNDDFNGQIVLKQDVSGSLDLPSKSRWNDFTHAILRDASDHNGWATIENLAAGDEPLYPDCDSDPTVSCGGTPPPAAVLAGSHGGPDTIVWANVTYDWEWYSTDGCDDGSGVPCEFRWSRKDEGESQWTLVSQSSSYSWNAPVDTFDFELKTELIRELSVEIDEGADTVVEYYSVHVESEPLPPVTATIDGPSLIEPQTNYTWTASVSGGSGSTTYQWYRAEDEGEGPGPWQAVGTSSSYTGSDADCHGFDLKLEVTREFPAPGQNSDTDILSVSVDDGGGTACLEGF